MEAPGHGLSPAKAISFRTARMASRAIFGLVLVLTAGGAMLEAAAPVHSPGSSGLSAVLFPVSMFAFALVGIIVLRRQPQNTVGWILLAVGLAAASGAVGSYGAFAIAHGLPGGPLAISLSGPLWAPPIALMGTSLILRFPDGRLPSPAWRKVEWLAWIGIVLVAVAIVGSPGPLTGSGYPDIQNPLGIPSLEPVLKGLFGAFMLIPATIVASAVALVRRFRRSTGVERLQLKWLASSGAVVAGAYLLAMASSISFWLITEHQVRSWGLPGTPSWIGFLQLAATAAFVLIPIAIGIAILRYRLYDIDLVINRTLVYGVLTGALALIYVGLVLGLGTVARSVGGSSQSPVVVAASTLIAAALFRPLRRRVQGFIDRRFYRRRYDARRALDAFAGTLRNEVDLESLASQIKDVVHHTIQPVRADLWLRSSPLGRAR